MSDTRDVRVLADADAVSAAVAEAIRRQAIERPIDRAFSLALTGGRTPRGLYQRLAAVGDFPWPRVHVFWSDERYLPLDDPDSNYRLAWETLLAGLQLPAVQLHPAPTDLDDPEMAARRYDEEIRRTLGSDAPRLDCVLLGMGPDGHIASLFPGSSILDEPTHLVRAVLDSPKPPARRLTMTLRCLNLGERVHLIVTGAEKAQALRATLEGPPDPRRYPAQQLRPSRGTLTWWVDEAAAAELRDPDR